MMAAERQLLIFERRFSPEKRCLPQSVWGIMPSACFSAPFSRGLVEGASAGQHVAAGAAWVDLPQADPSGRATPQRRTAVVKHAKEFGAVLVPFQSMIDEAVKLAPPEYWAADGVHPTAAGHLLRAKCWQEKAASR